MYWHVPATPCNCSLNRFLVYRIDPLTGMLTLLDSADVPYPTMIEQYKQHATCTVDGAAQMASSVMAVAVAKAAASHPLTTVGVGVVLVVGAMAFLRGHVVRQPAPMM